MATINVAAIQTMVGLLSAVSRSSTKICYVSPTRLKRPFCSSTARRLTAVHGEKAHSRYFSDYAFEKMTGVKPEEGKSAKVGNKELLIIPDAVHTDLYDNKAGVIPYDRIAAFFRENLK